MELVKLATIVGLLTLMLTMTALAEGGGDEGGPGIANPLAAVCSIHVSHDCGMIASAIPSYPRLTELANAECAVSFRVKDDGSVSVISASCDDDRFIDSALQGMSTVRYKTHDVCGKVCREVGRTYEQTIVFTLDSSNR
jgi:hypothetical protein